MLNHKRKSIFICHNYKDESFSSMSFHLANELANEGFSVVFFSYRPYFEKPIKKKIGKGEIEILSWPGGLRPTSWKAVYLFTKYFLQHTPAIVISHFAASNISITISKIISFGRAKTIEHYHTISAGFSSDSLFSKLKVFRKAVFYHLFCSTVVCPSSLAAAELSTIFGYYKFVIIPNALQDLNYKATKNEINFDHLSERVILFIGRKHPVKGLDILLEAFKKYCFETDARNLKLKIIGVSPNEIEEYSNLPGLEVVGKIDYLDVCQNIQKSFAVIIPSVIDNLPTVGIEALMYGKLLLISKNTGLSDYLSENDCIKFDSNISEIKKQFNRIQNMEYTTYERLCLNARKAYEANFNIEKYINNFKKKLNDQ
jgi:glycosyltransferase involved in cell wall biosynthesis